ncbi:MAG TPA: YggT family protein [Sulfurimonas sp.]|nr:YggT family protein [Sulfurimonas sp.]
MSALMEIILGLFGIFNTLIMVYMWVIIIASLLTWVKPDPFNPIVQLLYRLTNPAYALVRRYMPTTFNGIDLSPLIIIISLQILQVLMHSLMHSL